MCIYVYVIDSGEMSVVLQDKNMQKCENIEIIFSSWKKYIKEDWKHNKMSGLAVINILTSTYIYKLYTYIYIIIAKVI